MHGRIGSIRSLELADLGRDRLGAGDYGNAESLLRAALDEDPDCYDAWVNLGVVSGQAGEWAAAAAAMERAINLRSDDVAPWSNYGLHLLQMQMFEKSDLALSTAMGIDPDHYGVHHNLGLLRYNQERPGEAIEFLKSAIRLYESAGKSSLGARSDLSLAVLKCGRLHDGLVLNEVRWDGMLAKLAPWSCGLQFWRGEDLTGKTILVHSEQGLGDTIQFVRFIPELKARGARVIFAAPKVLVRLLSGNGTPQCGVDVVIDIGDLGELVVASREADYHAPILSVVKEIGTEFEGPPERSVPYLRPVQSPAGRRANTVLGGGFRVGLVWAASPGYQRSRERSVPVEELLVLLRVPGVKLYSLQHGPFREDLGRNGVHRVVADLSGMMEDMADTSELMSQLDLVISVDTGPMHLAAAMGVRTWLIQPLVKCWRWCYGVEPWYNCAREFCQVRARDWSSPIGEMVVELGKLVSSRGGPD